MIPFAVPPLLGVVWLAVKASRVLQIALIVLPVVAVIGVKVRSAAHDARIRREATTIERLEAESRRLKNENAILEQYGRAGIVRQAARDASVASSEAVEAAAARQMEEARNASASIYRPDQPVFSIDDPWLLKRAAPGPGNPPRGR